MNDKQRSLTGSIREQAGYWIVRQNSGNWSPQDAQDFRQWLTESPEHRQTFEQVKGLWRGLDQFKTMTTPTLASVQRRRHTKQRQRWAMGGVCAAVMVISLLMLKIDPATFIPSETTYATAKGQQTSVTLADGSEIVLNTDTELIVQFSPLRRLITLNHGEASFNVAHETLRGFTVRAGSGEIMDIGTRFNVNQTPEQVVVTVTEGAVKLQTSQQNSPPLVAGQRQSYNAGGILSLPDRADLGVVTAWQHGQIVFNMTPLSEVTAQLSRYHPVKFVFDDPKLKQLKMSGAFNTKDLPVFLDTLESIYPLRAQRGSDQTVHLKMATQR
jgi:transmembrane sensor